MMAADFPDLPQIYVLPHLGEGEPVAYGAVAAGEGAREFLAARLLEALGTIAGLGRGPGLGRPGVDRRPAWAAAPQTGGEARAGPFLQRNRGPPLGRHGGAGQAGVDAALEKDFASPYPFARAFRREEWDWAWRHCQGRAPAAAAALLWAAKEAAVKALGTGFHTMDPRDLEVVPLPRLGGARSWVRARGRERLGPAPGGWLAGPGRSLRCPWSNHRAQRRYLEVEDKFSLNRVKIILTVVFLSIYVIGASVQAFYVNTDMDKADQADYLSRAISLKADLFKNMSDGNRMPLYPYLLSFVYHPGMSMEEYFRRGKIFNIILSILLLFALYLIFRGYLEGPESKVLLLIIGFTVFMPRAGYVQCELLFYFLVFCGFVTVLGLFKEAQLVGGGERGGPGGTQLSDQGFRPSRGGLVHWMLSHLILPYRSLKISLIM